MTKTNKEKLAEGNYEAAIARLEAIVQRLEAGEIGLEESLALFEEGIGLAKNCAVKLDAAEGRLEKLLSVENGVAKTIPFPLKTEEEL
jgi:exodeoxyribonuclease VII small subunit